MKRIFSVIHVVKFDFEILLSVLLRSRLDNSIFIHKHLWKSSTVFILLFFTLTSFFRFITSKAKKSRKFSLNRKISLKGIIFFCSIENLEKFFAFSNCRAKLHRKMKTEEKEGNFHHSKWDKSCKRYLVLRASSMSFFFSWQRTCRLSKVQTSLLSLKFPNSS